AEEDIEMTPGFFPVSDGAKQLIDEANLLLRQGADSDSKIEALENLVGIDHPDILPTIELALDDEDPVVREVALDAIMNINSEEVVPIVVKALDDPEPDLRLVSLDALMDVKSPSINDALQKAMKDESEEVREGVMDLLFISENPAALPTIKTAFSDSSPAIREGALMCIEDIRDKGAVDILIYDGMLSNYEDVREASKEALEFITDEEFETYDEAKAWWNKNRDSFEFDF
ncbi:HEAT repeat domain-containing protein, partial [bacterium]|nr:HEAT repeat domain-containing protein [bacterium]